MRIPRNISGNDLVKKLRPLGYSISRQVGSHIRLTTIKGGEHHITITNHNPIRVGTLSAILGKIASHHNQTKSELLQQLFA